MTIENYIKKVEDWAEDRNLINGSDAKSQTLKLMSEVGELADNVLKDQDCRDDIGDCLIVLIILCKQKRLDIEKCLEIAYDDIKDRRGVMYNGAFIKSTDASYNDICHAINTGK